MSEQFISHLSEHYTLGSTFSSSNGIKCYPATDNRTGMRFVAKVQKIPYSESVTDAFFLSGAYVNIDDINKYYQNLAKDLCRQAAILNALSNSKYFSHFTACDMVNDGDVGYDVWLMSPYRTTLATLLGKVTFSQEQIIEIGLCLCRALSLCREAGFLYTGIKPENIYISDDGVFTIGDIGFIPLASLPYAALPINRYTVYTPQDCHDCFARLCDNLDIYGVGVVLHQACTGDRPLDRITNPPQSVKKELADVIMTACCPTAEGRWKTPEEMEKALISCMGRDENKG